MKIARYFLVGGVAAGVDFLLFAGLVKGLGFDWKPCAVLSFSVATVVNYVLSVRHVFESGVRFKKNHEIFLVFFVSAVGLAINQGVLFFLIEEVHMDVLVSKIVGTGSVFFWNYGARRHFIFRGSR